MLLVPSCGYYLKLDSDRNGDPIQWELTSNHPDFKARSETVPLDGFLYRESSWSGSAVVQFPNQIDRLSNDKLKGMEKPRLGIKLLTATLRGTLLDQPYEVAFNVRLSSDGPACVSASEARRIIILGHEDVLLPYEGDGKYELRTKHAIE